MTSSNRNSFCVTDHMCGEFNGTRWIPCTRASDAGLWCFFDLRLTKRVSKQSWGWWFETPSRPLWRHRDDESSGNQFSAKYIWIKKSWFSLKCVSKCHLQNVTYFYGSQRYQFFHTLPGTDVYSNDYHRWPLRDPKQPGLCQQTHRSLGDIRLYMAPYQAPGNKQAVQGNQGSLSGIKTGPAVSKCMMGRLNRKNISRDSGPSY